MAVIKQGGDLLPDIRLVDVLQQRHSGLGSPIQVSRLALAVTVSWLIAEIFSQSSLGIFAPVTTLLVVQSTPWSTLGLSLQRILGTGVGVLAASIWVNSVGLSWWSFLLAMLASLLVARLIPWSIAGQVQIPVAVVFVLALGPGTMGQDAWRVIDVVIGGVVGLLAVYVYPPRPRPQEFEGALQLYRDEVLIVLAGIGEECGALERPLPDGVNHDFVTASRALRGYADASRVGLIKLAESVQWNPRGRRFRDRLQSDARRLRRLGGIAVQVRGLAGAANLLFDRQEASGLPRAAFAEIIEHLVVLAVEVLGARGEPVGHAGEPIGCSGGQTVDSGGDGERGASAGLALLIRSRADELMGDGHHVGHLLESVSLLGRVDHIRQQLTIFASGDDADADMEATGLESGGPGSTDSAGSTGI
jgi:hypothetical protein